MSEKQCRDFSQYDSMTTEELEELLRADLEAESGDESDTELLLYVMEVLAERKKNSENSGNTAQNAWASFQKYYLHDKAIVRPPESEKPKYARSWFRRASAIAAAFALLVSFSVAALALDWEKIFNAIGTWTTETFSFVSGEQNEEKVPTADSTKTYGSLQEALRTTGQPFDFVPVWIPEGYKLLEVSINETPEKRTYNAFYTNGEVPLRIFIQTYLSFDPEHIEGNGDLLEIYKSAGVEYNIFLNMNQVQVVWHTDLYECCIACELEIDEVKMMIDSIGKG